MITKMFAVTTLGAALLGSAAYTGVQNYREANAPDVSQCSSADWQMNAGSCGFEKVQAPATSAASLSAPMAATPIAAEPTAEVAALCPVSEEAPLCVPGSPECDEMAKLTELCPVTEEAPLCVPGSPECDTKAETTAAAISAPAAPVAVQAPTTIAAQVVADEMPVDCCNGLPCD